MHECHDQLETSPSCPVESTLQESEGEARPAAGEATAAVQVTAGAASG